MKSRSLWLLAGDKNSAFFDRQCRARLSRNHISEISVEGEITKGHEPLKHAARKHYQFLFHEDGISNFEVTAYFLSNIPSIVSPEGNVGLMKPFTKNEILEVIWEMGSNKAPGPDGFSFHFYRACWNIIKIDLIRIVTSF